MKIQSLQSKKIMLRVNGMAVWDPPQSLNERETIDTLTIEIGILLQKPEAWNLKLIYKSQTPIWILNVIL